MKNKIFLSIYLPIFITLSSLVYSSNNYYPDSSWDSVSPESQNIKSKNVEDLIDIAFTDKSTLGVVVIKNGKIIFYLKNF